MIRNFISCFLFFCSISLTSFSQAIYSGGNGSGFSSSCYFQISNTALEIYSGGNSDGASNDCYLQMSNTALEIYGGGNDDGSSNDCYLQPNNTALEIYGGGNDDGFSYDCYLQLNNTALEIYSGGSDDGFSKDCYLQLNNTSLEIYGGGSDDGFSKDCYAQQDALPIDLLFFNATPYADYVLLQWKTSSELNNDYFTIEKTKDVSTYSPVAIIDGAGTSTKIIDYSSLDHEPYSGTSYYRLKQTDFNGNHSYSSLVKIDYNRSGETSFVVYPNPSSGEGLTIAIDGEKGEEVLVVLYDVCGRINYSKVYILEDNGTSVSALEPSGKLTPGIYIITASSQETMSSKKLIIK